MALPLLWIDGRFHPVEAPAFAATDRGATLGDAVFDTALCLGGTVVQRDAHLERLTASIRFFKYHVQPDLLQAAYAIAGQTDLPAVLRITISRGAGARGFDLEQPQTSQITANLTHLSSGLQFAPQAFDIAGIRRNDSSPLSQHKMAAYLDPILALDHAKTRGFTDTFFLNAKGNVACSATANVFAVAADRLMTPPITDGALPGITRALLLRLAPALRLSAEECSISPDMLRAADEVFVCNSLRLIVPVQNLGGSSYRIRSALADALRAEIADEAGIVIDPPQWEEAR